MFCLTGDAGPADGTGSAIALRYESVRITSSGRGDMTQALVERQRAD
jgi:hypothetical protein